MSDYKEILPVRLVTKDGIKYMEKSYGIAKRVFEKHLIPIPDKIITRIFKDDGTEDIAKLTEEVIK